MTDLLSMKIIMCRLCKGIKNGSEKIITAVTSGNEIKKRTEIEDSVKLN